MLTIWNKQCNEPKPGTPPNGLHALIFTETIKPIIYAKGKN